MHDAASAGRRRDLDELANGSCVHRSVGGIADACLAIDRGDVINDLHIFCGPRERGAIVERTYRRLDARRFEILRLNLPPREAAHLITALHKRPCEVASRESGGAGN
jgi:hypothetical protein